MEISYLLLLIFGVFSSTIGSKVKSAAELSLEELVRHVLEKMEEMEIEKLEWRIWGNNLSAKLQELEQTMTNVEEKILEQTLKIFENSSFNFLKDCANSSSVSTLEKNLKELETNARTLQSELSTRLEVLEERSVLSDDILEMKKTLTNHSSLLSRLNQQLWEVENTCAGEPPSIVNGKPLKFDRKPKSFVQYECDQDLVVTGNSTVLCEYGKWEGHPPICTLGTCAGEPPSILNGKPLKFDRKHKSVVQYECDQDFVVTGTSTVLCEYGKWEGHPPICSFFDTTFTLVAILQYNRSITCYSDRYSQNIEFVREVDTGTGLGLPKVSRQEGPVLNFTETPSTEIFGVYECRFHVDNRSAGIVVPLRDFDVIRFSNRSVVANIGETVELRLGYLPTSIEQSKLRWRHNGVLVPKWDGRWKVDILDVQPSDAGIYECYVEGKRRLYQALLRLIVRKCEKNRYGGNCEQECPVCYNGGVCHDLLGVCICPVGFTGKNCELACGENHVSGACTDLCLRDDCKHQLFCKPDPYGCSCFPGLTGFYCSIRCDPGRYGAGCMQPCHCVGDCDIYTGACSGGCSAGWTGESCQIEVVK